MLKYFKLVKFGITYFYSGVIFEKRDVIKSEKGHLLEIHLLKKSARHQNLDCSTPFEQMTKIYETARKSKKYVVCVVSSRCKF
jgi:hypothetical protein